MTNKGYVKEILKDQIVVLRITSSAREVVDACYEVAASALAEARQQHTCARLLYDVRKLDAVTPYGLRRAEDLGWLPLPDQWRVSALVSSPMVATLYNYLKAASLQPAVRDNSRLFTDEDEALAWLRQV